MTKFILIVFFFFGFSQTIKADTIDYWNVYKNGIKLKGFNEYSNNKKVILKRNSINSNDTLQVIYFKDTPCRSCSTAICIYENTDKIILKTNGVGTFNPISILLTKLINSKIFLYNKFYKIFYTEYNNLGNSKSFNQFLFELKIE